MGIWQEFKDILSAYGFDYYVEAPKVIAKAEIDAVQQIPQNTSSDLHDIIDNTKRGIASYGEDVKGAIMSNPMGHLLESTFINDERKFDHIKEVNMRGKIFYQIVNAHGEAAAAYSHSQPGTYNNKQQIFDNLTEIESNGHLHIDRSEIPMWERIKKVGRDFKNGKKEIAFEDATGIFQDFTASSFGKIGLGAGIMLGGSALSEIAAPLLRFVPYGSVIAPAVSILGPVICVTAGGALIASTIFPAIGDSVKSVTDYFTKGDDIKTPSPSPIVAPHIAIDVDKTLPAPAQAQNQLTPEEAKRLAATTTLADPKFKGEVEVSPTNIGPAQKAELDRRAANAKAASVPTP